MALNIKPLIDPRHPFFAPVWRRWATAGVPGAWAVVEFVNGSPQWAVCWAALSAYAALVLLIRFPQDGGSGDVAPEGEPARQPDSGNTFAGEAAAQEPPATDKT